MRLSELNTFAYNEFSGCEVLTDDYGQIIIYTGLMRDPKDSGHDPELVDFEEEEPEKKDLAFGWDPNVNYEDEE